MLDRIAALLALSVVFVGGGLFLADQYSVAQSPPTASAPVAQPAAAPPIIEAPPVVAQVPPSVVAPTGPEPGHDQVTTPGATPVPAPVVTAPAEQATPPVVSAPPAQAPVVTAPAPEAPALATPTPMPPDKPALSAAEKLKGVAAKFLFAAKQLPTLGKAMAIGYYPRGCLQGGVELPVDGPNWEVMRLSRNRNWGHPELVHFLKTFAPLAAKATGWHGILVGDMAQPRGGPLPFGHMSHQIGLDVDIWFMPKPDRVLTKDEREKISAINLVAADWKHIDPKMWTPAHAAFIRTAAEQPAVERVLVNAAIKKQLCEMQGDKHPSWMDKVRPWYGHHDHIHVRLKCPADSPNCRAQPAVPGDAGCADKDLASWFSDKVLHPKPSKEPAKPKPALTMADLPPACKTVLDAPAKNKNLAADGR
jgi:penicillin-insensitive murein endopeptidase